jgi:hypothetical protein
MTRRQLRSYAGGCKMKIVIGPPARGVMGWNFDVSVEAGADEKIEYVEVRVNDFPQVRDTLGDPEDSWQQSFTQQGVYPGENKAEVLVRSVAKKETRAERKWQ